MRTMKKSIFLLLLFTVAFYSAERLVFPSDLDKWDGFWEGAVCNDADEYNLNLEINEKENTVIISELFPGWNTLKSKCIIDDSSVFARFVAEFSLNGKEKKKHFVFLELHYDENGRAFGVLKTCFCKGVCSLIDADVEKMQFENIFDVIIDKVP